MEPTLTHLHFIIIIYALILQLVNLKWHEEESSTYKRLQGPNWRCLDLSLYNFIRIIQHINIICTLFVSVIEKESQ